MAETLGSLVDKFTIKRIREYHLEEMLNDEKSKFSVEEIKERLQLLEEQRKALLIEIESFIAAALRGDIQLRDDKLKIYNDPSIIGKIGEVPSLAHAMDGLTRKNLELWHLEDEARRKDVSLEYIGEVKQKIDVTNQHRNDFIDTIDKLLEKVVADAKTTA